MVPSGLPPEKMPTWPSSRKYILSRLNSPPFWFSEKNTVPAAACSSLPTDSKNAFAIAGT